MADFDLSYIVKAVDKFSPVFEKLVTAVQKQEKELTKFQSRMSRLSSSLKTIGGNLRNYLTLPIMAAAGYAFKTFSNFENMKLRLKAMTKSSAEYEQVWKNVKSLSMEMPFSPEQLATSSQQLLSAKVAVGDIKNRLKEYGMVAIVSNKTLEETTDMFTKMEKRGGGASRMLSNLKGIPIVPMLHQMYLEVHKTDAGWDKWFKKGVKFEVIKKALDRMTASGTEFAKSADLMFNTATSTMEVAHNAFRIYLDDLVEGILGTNDNAESLKKMKKIIADFEPIFEDWAKNHGTLLRTYASIVLIAAALSPVLYLMRAIAAIGTIIASPFVVIGGAILSALYALAQFIKLLHSGNWEMFTGDYWKGVVSEFKQLVTMTSSTSSKEQQALGWQKLRGGVNENITPLFGSGGQAAALNMPAAMNQSKVNIDMRVHDKSGIIGGINSRSSGLLDFNVDRGYGTAFAK